MLSNKKLSQYAPVVLRLAISVVFLWFGTSQLVNPTMWVSIVPLWATGLSGMSASTIVHLNGAFEVVFGILLVLGIYVRWVALLLFLHLIPIAAQMGLTPIGVRDFGLSFATLSVALFGNDQWCLMKPDTE